MRNRQRKLNSDASPLGPDPDDEFSLRRAGRRVGSTKVSRHLVEKLRKQGKTNEEIASELKISTRTVTRYLGTAGQKKLSLAKTFATLNSQYAKSLFQIHFSKINSYDRAMAMFILRESGHPQWEQVWRGTFLHDQLKAIAIKRMFGRFLDRCNWSLEDLHERFPSHMADLIEAKNKWDFPAVNSLWQTPTSSP